MYDVCIYVRVCVWYVNLYHVYAILVCVCVCVNWEEVMYENLVAIQYTATIIIYRDSETITDHAFTSHTYNTPCPGELTTQYSQSCSHTHTDHYHLHFYFIVKHYNL